MGAGHSHDISGSAAGRHRWRLVVAFILVGGFFGVELVVGLISQSLALLSDAGHMAADVTTLGAALIATRLAAKPDSSGRRTYGRYRAEIFASGFAVLVMLGVSIYIAIEAISRIGNAPEIATGMVLVVGALGLVINIISMFLLRSGAKESLNLKGAYLEVLADTLGSVGVIVAGLMVSWTGNVWWDTGIALFIAIFVAFRALILAREVLRVLGQHAPAGMEPSEILQTLESVPGVVEVHDLHVWTLTSGMDVATAHLVAQPDNGPEVLSASADALKEKFGIAHATLQVESPDKKECTGADW
ncbi:cation diffusion facilitator family transporter [Epidermidibacterium keratini]|uniref:Cation diffusion facilitator family transporter n=1 Tax=Epidermidibacterium keratini TaxID=1891644 RepID=A0A7L4YNV2_9ACTN|nr:cation diffusion facilitator family transporter [Epidermidibacterium keratini]QHC00961.1 cation diffusion facilitator family transporter [Epidermidibacterium keratini]